MVPLKNKRVLIISNNALSTQNNNGKTLLSFFKFLPKENIAQLYFSDEPANHDLASKYYRISDRDIIKSFAFWRKGRAESKEVTSEHINEATQEEDHFFLASSLRNFEVARTIREVAWKISRTDKKSLREWVNNFNPEIIFFCAGDSAFAYRFYNTVISVAPMAKKVLYVTDDYILPRIKFSPFWWLRRNIVYSRMKQAAVNSDVFVTISQEMRNEYRARFGKDSITIFNVSANMRIENFQKSPRKDLLLVYMGGLHFERWKTLILLAKTIKVFNDEKKRAVTLKIYSHQKVDKGVLRELAIPGASEYCGALNAEGVRQQLNDADILVHVESFNKKCIESTRLSISTKIAEYLSSQSRILAIGPESLASMRFLEGNEKCITSVKDLGDGVFSILECRKKNDYSKITQSLITAQEIFHARIFSQDHPGL